MVVCKRCNFETKVKINLKTHLQRNSPCKIINKNIDRGVLIEELYPSVSHVKNKCPDCDKSYIYKSGLDKHKRIHHKKNLNNNSSKPK